MERTAIIPAIIHFVIWFWAMKAETIGLDSIKYDKRKMKATAVSTPRMKKIDKSEALALEKRPVE